MAQDTRDRRALRADRSRETDISERQDAQQANEKMKDEFAGDGNSEPGELRGRKPGGLRGSPV